LSFPWQHFKKPKKSSSKWKMSTFKTFTLNKGNQNILLNLKLML
jgi:hypothetical protein